MKGLKFLVILALAIVAGILLSSFTLTINGVSVPFKTFIPNIVVPSEPLGPDWFHNTLFTTLIVDAVIIVLAVGFDDQKKIGKHKGALLIRNSWGVEWGEGGYGWLPYEYIEAGLAADFWSMVEADFVSSNLFQ